MATAERSVAGADEKAWELFFEALDPDSDAAQRIPSGAAFVAADAFDRHELVRSYRAEGRAVVLVDVDGHEKVVRPPLDRRWLVAGFALLAAVVLLRRPAGA